MTILRLAVESDFEAYYRIKCGKSDIYWNGFSQKPDFQRLRASFMQRLAYQPNIDESKVIYMIETEDKVACGYVMFHYTEISVEISISILEEYQREGYGTLAIREALTALKLEPRCIFARIRPDNIPSQKCFEKNGFVFKIKEEAAHFFPMDNRSFCYNRFELVMN